jgi:hypothetical protein
MQLMDGSKKEATAELRKDIVVTLVGRDIMLEFTQEALIGQSEC